MLNLQLFNLPVLLNCSLGLLIIFKVFLANMLKKLVKTFSHCIPSFLYHTLFKVVK